MKLVVTLALLTAACTRGAPPSAPPPPVTTSPPAHPAVSAAPIDGPRCLPIVSGCGCAYACASTVHLLDGGVHEVAHDLQDSRLDRVTVARWCFDAAGHGSPERRANPAQRDCVEVFFDGTPCGGECIPRTDVLRCASVENHCAAAPAR